MTTSTLSPFDRDRVALTLRQVGEVAQDLRREYPEAFEAGGVERETPASPATPTLARTA